MSDRASRITSYKYAGLGNTDLRRKRAEVSVNLRKQARDEQLLKRRAVSPEAEDVVDEKVATPADIVKGLKSDDLAIMTTSARAARRMLSREQNPPISVMVNAGVIKPLVEALDRDDCPDLQFEASWALTNIASGTSEHTMAVVNSGAIPKLVQLLGHGGTVGEQSAWALGNIAGDGAATRDIVLKAGALPALLPLLNTNTVASQLRTAVWTYSNFCRNKDPLVAFDLVSPALPYIAELLEVDDKDVLSDACWAMSYLTDGPNDRIEAVQTTKQLLPRLVRLLRHEAVAVRTPALRAIGNMLTGSDDQTDRCLDANCLPPLNSLLRCGKSALMKEASWAYSNVLAGTPAQIQRALDAGCLEHLLHVLTHEDAKCQKEAAWAITNLCLGGTPEQLDALLQAGFLEPYCNILGSPDHRAVTVVLDGLNNLLQEAAWAITNLCLGGTPEQLDALLQAGFLEPYCNILGSPDHRAVTVVLDGLNNLLQAAAKYGQVEPLCLKLEEIGALDRIEGLQRHDNEQVYKKTLTILDTYFADQEDATAQPQQTEQEYQFGTTAPENINF